MKRLLLLLITLHSSLIILFSQAPQGFNYQAVARDDGGELLASQTIDVKIGIRAGSESGTLVWEETHTVMTNEFGLFTLMIGDPEAQQGSGSAATFSDIEWSTGAHYLEVSIKTDVDFIPMGTSELLSVPFALFAEEGNEGQDLHLTGDILTIDNGVNNIDLAYYLDDTNPWSLSGNTIFYNEGNVGVGTETPGSRLEVMGNLSGDPIDPLFEVKRKDGQTVFAVYEDSVRIFVNTEETGKGTKGGFAVGGFTPGKGVFEQEYLRVTPDSVRIYIDETITGKGTKGGFAVGGFNPATKSSPVSLLHLSKENYFIGHESGVETTGLYNTFFGYQSGMSNVGGSFNVFIGYQSGISNYGGNNNVFLGLRAGYNNTNGGDNTFIGNWSGYYNQTGSNNIIIGKLAGVDNLSNNNIFLGNESGRNNETGDRNIYFGYKAGHLATSASNNVFIGDSAGYGATSGYNICIGNSSGISLTSGGNNVLIGRQAGYNTTTASSTVTIGNKAGFHSNDDDGCVFIGNMAGYHNVNGDYNTLIGFFAGYNVTGHFNTYVGEASGYDWYNQNKVNDGTGNTLLGYYSGSEITSGDYNTLVGYAAGFGVAGGNNNVIIGRNAGHEVGSGSGNVFIGYEAGYNEAGSSKLYIDNSSTSTPLIYGDFLNDQLTFNSSLDVTGDVNFGDTSNKGKFNVGGNGGIQGVMVLNRFIDDGVLIRFRRDGATMGDISVSSGVVSYNAFTGSHYAWTDEEIEKGMLVSMTGVNHFLEGNDESEILYGVTQTNRANDANILGAYLSLQNPSQLSTSNNPHMIMAVGNGNIWVVDNGEDLQQGDYLISSTIPGHAMKDNGEFDIAYVIARVAEPVHWAEVDQHIDGKKHKCVSVFFESFTANHKAERLETEIENLRNEINLLKQNKMSSISMEDDINALKTELEVLKQMIGITAVERNKE